MLLLSLLVACGGTALTQLESGYAIGPHPMGPDHGATLSAHAGGSDIPGFGIGVSGRARIMTDAWAVPEIGPHVFLMVEEDAPVAFVLRANPWVGLGGVSGDVRPMFTAGISPGLLLYPGESPLALSLMFTAEYTIAPSMSSGGSLYTRGWLGVQLGFAIGGVKY